MKSSRERWAQLVARLEGQAGGPGRPEAEAIRFGDGDGVLPGAL